MKVIDLTYTLTENMQVYPGTKPPVLKGSAGYEKFGCRETILTVYSHTGTHMDAPAHIFPDGTTLDKLDASMFFGKALVIDCRGAVGEIGMEYIEPNMELCDKADFLLFMTGWDEFYGEDKFFKDYPLISEDVCRYLKSSGKKGAGFDVISPDPVSGGELIRHKILLSGEDFVIIENLTGLDALGSGLVDFYAFPLKFDNADGSPVRAVAVL